MDRETPREVGSNFLWVGARLAVGALFALAGFMKLMEPAANFQAVLEQYPLLPAAAAPFLSRGIPWVEWIGGMFLLLGYLTRMSAGALALLSMGFVVVLSGPVVWRVPGLDECGCFGSSWIPLTLKQAYLLDWLLLSSALAIFFRRKKPVFSLDQFLRGSDPFRTKGVRPLLVFVFLFFCPSLGGADETDLNDQGVLAAQGGRFEEGVALLRQAREVAPEDESVRKNLSRVLTDWALVLKKEGKRKQMTDALEEALRHDPASGIALVVLADEAYLTEGNLSRAVELWHRAYSKVPAERQADLLRRLTQGERDLMIERGFRSLDTKHFRVRFEGSENRQAADRLGEVLEREYARLSQMVGQLPEGLNVIVYTRESFERIAGRRDWTLGLYDGRIRLRLEEVGNETLPQVISHELGHAFLAQTYGSVIPTWLHEGFAQVVEPPQPVSLRQKEILEAVASKNAWIPLKWLDRRFEQPSHLENLERAYAQSQYVVDFLVARYGTSRFQQFLKELSQGKPIEQAFDGAFSPSRWIRVDQGNMD